MMRGDGPITSKSDRLHEATLFSRIGELVKTSPWERVGARRTPRLYPASGRSECGASGGRDCSPIPRPRSRGDRPDPRDLGHRLAGTAQGAGRARPMSSLILLDDLGFGARGHLRRPGRQPGDRQARRRRPALQRDQHHRDLRADPRRAADRAATIIRSASAICETSPPAFPATTRSGMPTPRRSPRS